MRTRAWWIALLIGSFALRAEGQATQTAEERDDPTARRVERPTPGEQAATRAVVHREGRAATRPTSGPAEAGDRVSVTEHSITIAGRKIDYTAMAGTLVQKDEAGKPKADMFYVSYTVDDGQGGPTTSESSAPVKARV